MKSRQLPGVALAALALLGCDGQQYVSPDTALLSVSHDTTGSKLVSRCNYVPVLLGSQVDRHYAVDGGLEVFITLTRDDITVTFQDDGQMLDPFHVTTKELEAGVVADPSAPAGYTAELSRACAPDDDP